MYLGFVYDKQIFSSKIKKKIFFECLSASDGLIKIKIQKVVA